MLKKIALAGIIYGGLSLLVSANDGYTPVDSLVVIRNEMPLPAYCLGAAITHTTVIVSEECIGVVNTDSLAVFDHFEDIANEDAYAYRVSSIKKKVVGLSGTAHLFLNQPLKNITPASFTVPTLAFDPLTLYLLVWSESKLSVRNRTASKKIASSNSWETTFTVIVPETNESFFDRVKGAVLFDSDHMLIGVGYDQKEIFNSIGGEAQLNKVVWGLHSGL